MNGPMRKEKVMKRILICAVLFCLLASPVVLAAGESHNKVLNNFVSELMSLSEQALTSQKKISFMNPRQGWCFFAVSGKATVWLNDEKQPLMAGKAGGESAEAMRQLPAGRHTLQVEGQPSGLIVRAIPVLQHAFYEAESWIRTYGPYDWEFLKKDVLPNVNVMISVPQNNPPHLEESTKQGLRWIGRHPTGGWYAREDHLNEWTGQGRSWIAIAPNPFRARDDVPADEAYESWAGAVGLNEPLMSGIIVDEFGGGDQPKYGAFCKAIERIYANPKFKGKTYSPYSYGSGILSNDLSREFARACIKGGGYVCIERYLAERPSRQAAASHIREQMTSGWNMPRYEKDLPGITRKTVMVLGYLSQPSESLNVNPAVDFKVYLDMQMRFLALEPAYRGLGGIQMYHSGYADEETVRWAGRLYRHYCIEGKRKLLSEELGFKYQLDHIRNPDFAEGTNNWEIQPAEADSIASREHPKYGHLQFRYGGAPPEIGDTFLWTKRSAEKANVFSQEIQNLTPGRLYSMKMVSGDYQDLVQAKSEKKLHGVSVRLDNVDILPGEKKSFQYIFESHYARPVDKFGGSHNYYMNYHWRVFRAKGATARLVVSDWNSETEPGGPVGQELIFNFIEIQPYWDD